MTTISTTPEAKVVEGSDGLLLEIDGQIVPNYDATFTLFEEGEVVSGIVVRIDKDEVLVDITAAIAKAEMKLTECLCFGFIN